MAEQSAQDVVIQAQSIGQDSPVDVSGTNYESNSTGEREARMLKEAGIGQGKEMREQSEFNAPESFKAASTNVAMYETHSGLAAEHKNSNINESQADEIGNTQSREVSAAAADHVMTNGDTGSNIGSDDAGYQHSNGIDTNPGSDTEMGTGESIGPSKDGILRRERSDSVKKIPSFKAVSVTKNFLAKSGAGVATAAKTAVDKAAPTILPSPPMQQPNRPRLVAKLGRDARSLNAVPGISPGPDANRVWNRNKPAAAPTPKQFTDEELKQQYGIHLATRLQADEGGKDAKWADIDDDEDDWAPETVEWMDGTKSTITATDNPLLLAADSRGIVSAQGDSVVEAESTLLQPVPTPAPGKTILRPGVRTQTTQTKPGLVLKGVPEKPVLLTKPSATSTVKSPWAPLPPVDKASPVTFVPPAHAAPPQQPERISSDARDFQKSDTTISPYPAREIAADDFNRNWRENENGNRELFNSQSGRYESVRPMRRPSRQESGLRPPSVLQRPSHAGSNPYPEPSASFQSSREPVVADRSPWDRRRGSNALEERHGHHDKRTPVDQSNGALFPPPTPAGQSSFKDSTGLSPSAQVATTSSDVATLVSPAVPETQLSHNPSEKGASFSNASQSADVRAVQQQLMKEKIALNRKRKQEEEAKEEAARKERIRLKLEALAVATSTEAKPDAKDVKAAEVPDVSSTKPLTPHKAAENPVEPFAHASAVLDGPLQDTTPTAFVAASRQSNSRLASPVAPRQVHLSVPAQLTSPDNEHNSPDKRDHGSADVGATLSREPHVRADLPVNHSTSIPRHQPWKPVQLNQEQAGWTGKRITSHSTGGVGNVWGPPTSDRTLGNGAFEAEFQRLGPPPGPIAPPSQTQTPVMTSEPFAGTPSVPSSLFTPSPHVDNPLPPPSSPFNHRPRSPAVEMFQRRPRNDVRSSKSGWHNFATQLPQLESQARERAAREHGARLAEESTPDFQPIYKETFRQTTASNVLGQRQVVAVSTTIHEGSSIVPESRVSMPPPGPSHVESSTTFASPPHLANNGRASRFFGPGIDRPVASTPRSPPELSVSFLNPSPPPPDGTGHPAFEINATGPRVNLPQPPPKVRLPPAAVLSSPPSADPTQVPARNQAVRNGAQPIVNQLAWQNRFNGLFGRAQPPSSIASSALLVDAASSLFQPRPETLAINSSSKAPLDVSSTEDTTTVSLPQRILPSRPAGSHPALLTFSAESKPAVDELMDDREPWSLPTVNFPKTPYPDTFEYLPALSSRYTPAKFTHLETAYEFSSTSFPIPFEFLEAERFTQTGYTIFIYLHDKFLAQKFVPHKAMHDANASRSSKGPRNKKRQPLTRGPSSGSQSPRPVIDGIVMDSDSSPRLDGEQRGAWAKAVRNNRFRQDKHIDVTSSGMSSELPTTKSGWAKPPKGRGGAFGKRA